MATLKALLKIFNKHSKSADKIKEKAGSAVDTVLNTKGATDTILNAKGVTDTILNASSVTDNFSEKLNDAGASANSASVKLGKYISFTKVMHTAKKGMSIADVYTNTATRLGLITDSQEEQKALQEEIFAAAQRSRGTYTDMAAAVANMGIGAGDVFGNNLDQLVRFTELMQKALRLGGASSGDQSDTMLQLTQAMSSGKLQGDVFQSMKENAPILANAIDDYMSNILKLKGTIEQWSADGLITAEVMKNAFLGVAKDIDTQVADLPYTFADYWNAIETGATKAFGSIIEKMSDLISTDGFQTFMYNLINGFNLVASAANWLIDVIVNGWDTIGPILAIIGCVRLVVIIDKIWSVVSALLVQGAATLMALWPLFLIIGAIALVISAARQLGASWEDIFVFIGELIGTLAAYFYNNFVYMWNLVAAFINFFGNVFSDPIASITILFFDLAVSVLGFVETMAQGIEDLLNKIPWIEVDITSGITGLRDMLSARSLEIKTEADYKTYVESKEYIDYSEAFEKGGRIGRDIYNNINSTFGNLTDFMSGGYDFDDFSFDVRPENVTSEVKLKMSDDDLRYLRDIAEREYVNKFSTATLAPNVTFRFGDIHETADIEVIRGKLEAMMREEIAVASEGSY